MNQNIMKRNIIMQHMMESMGLTMKKVYMVITVRITKSVMYATMFKIIFVPFLTKSLLH